MSRRKKKKKCRRKPPVNNRPSKPTPPPPAPTTPTLAELSKQAADLSIVESLILLISSGGQLADVEAFAADQVKDHPHWQRSKEDLKILWIRAGSEILNRHERDPGKQSALNILINRRLLALAIEQGDLRTAHIVNRTIAELQGLFPSKTQAKGKPGPGTMEHCVTLEDIQDMEKIQREYEDWQPPTQLVLAPPPDDREESTGKTAG